MSQSQPAFVAPGINIRRVPVDRPWVWIAAGWHDLATLPRLSLGFGVVIVAASLAASLGIWFAGSLYLLLPLAAGFFFVAPVLAIIFYEISRLRETGEPVRMCALIFAFRRNFGQIALMGLVVMFIHLVWMRIALLLFALAFGRANPSLDQLYSALLLAPGSLAFLVVGTVIGAVLATATFAICAVSIPMLLDRDVGVTTAIATSWVAVCTNWQAMALWAGLIVVFTSFGLATFYVGLAVALPLVGHASWHAYKDVVEWS